MEAVSGLTQSLQVFIAGEILSAEKHIKPCSEMSYTDARKTREILEPLLSNKNVDRILLDQVKGCLKTCAELSNYKSLRSHDFFFEQLEYEERCLARAFKKDRQIYDLETKMRTRNITSEAIRNFEERRYLLTYGDYFAEKCTGLENLDKSKALDGFWRDIQLQIRREQEMAERERDLFFTVPINPQPVHDAIHNVCYDLRYPSHSSHGIFFDIKEYVWRNELAHPSLQEYEAGYRWYDLANRLHQDQKNVHLFFKENPEYQKMITDTIEEYKKLHFVKFEPGEINERSGDYNFVKLVSRKQQKIERFEREQVSREFEGEGMRN